ncbi:hypothetical protein JCM8097_001912 [Rhodosporidiobolus ruineniae]
MSTRIRLPRKASEAARYTFDAADESVNEVDEHETDEDDEEAMRARRKKPTAKRRKVEISESEEEEDSGGDEVKKGGKASKGKSEPEYDIPRVDFSTKLPVELVNEILSYLGPSSLFALSTLSKTLYNLLTHASTRQLWLKALKIENLPKDGDDEVKPTRICALLLNKKCQACGKNEVLAPDPFLLVRLCIDCRHANWVPVGDVGPGKKYRDFHPAAMQCVIVTDYPPQDPRWYRSTRNFVYYRDLQAMDEQLGELQLLDDLESDNPFDETGPDATMARKNASQARRHQRHQRHGRGDTYTAVDTEKTLADQWSPRVKAFVEERRGLIKQRNKLADWIVKHGRALRDARDQEVNLMARLEQRVLDDGVFKRGHFNKLEWRENSLVKDCGVVTDEIWASLKIPLYRLLGKLSAEAIYKRSKKRADDSDDESGRPRLPKKPQSVSKQAWKYILPELRKVAKARRQDEVEESSQVKPVVGQPKPAVSAAKTPEPVLSYEQRSAQDSFLNGWRSRVLREQDGVDDADLVSLSDLRDLPSIKALRLVAKIGIDPENDEKDLVKLEAVLDAVLDESKEFILERDLDLHLQALKLILAANTDMDAQEIAALDSSVLLPNEDDEDDSPVYNDAFFRRPSSWVCCAGCGDIGPVDDILKDHAHHRYWSRRRGSGLVDLPLEVACAWSAVLELLQLDPEDETVTPEKVDKAMEGYVLLWENAPDHKPGKNTWQDLIGKVRRAAFDCDKKDVALPAPVVELKKYKKRPLDYGFFDRIFRW